MIKAPGIERFKSVKSLRLDCRRINLFIGESNVQQSPQLARLDFNGNQHTTHPLHGGEAFRFYRFKMLDKFDSGDPGALIPPDGRNLFSVVYRSKTMQEWFVDLYRPYGLAVVMKPHEKAFEMQKHQDGVVTAYPSVMSSDTLQRMLFYHAAMVSNKNAVLIFEEPEAHDIIDNRTEKLVDHLTQMLGLSERARFAVGYLFPSDLLSVAKRLLNLKELRLPIGNTTNRETVEIVEASAK